MSSIGMIALETLLTCHAEHSGADGVPLAFGQGESGEGVGVVGHEWCGVN
jgi:hypothetical protein